MPVSSLTLTAATLEKSYTTSANNVTSYSSTIAPTAALLYRLKVELMKVPGATVVQSCDGTNYDGTDRWASASNVVLASAGNRSWIVIKFDNTASDVTVMLSGQVDSATAPTQVGTITVSFNGAVDTYGTYAANSNPSASNTFTASFSSLASNMLLNQVPVVSSTCYSSDGKNFTVILNHAHTQYIFGMYEGVMYDQQATSFDTVLLRKTHSGVSMVNETLTARIGGTNSTLSRDEGNQPAYIIRRSSGVEYLMQPSFQVSSIQRFHYLKDVYESSSTTFTYQPGTLFPNYQDPALVSIGEYLVPWTGPSPTVYT